MKEYLVTASQMKLYDQNTINIHRLPSLLLMERAALVTVAALQDILGEKPARVAVISGSGNNGGDGLAVGRLLFLAGYPVDFVLLADLSDCTEETRHQAAILQSYGAGIFDRIEDITYDMDIVIDALLGVGLSRPVTGKYAAAVDWINERDAFVCSIDIPSGISADTGAVLGCAVQADLTVTYGFRKLGQMLYPGAGFCGRLVCGQMGIDERSFLGQTPDWYTYTGIEKGILPERVPDGHKGTFGKALVIAGSKQMGGAAILAAKSAFRTGAGMVKVVTAIENRDAILRYVPEAMLVTYQMEEEEREQDFWCLLKEAVSWADCVLIGPGIGQGSMAKALLAYCIEECSLPLVIDADGLNLLAQDQKLQAKTAGLNREVILTPHLGEFGRLYGCDTKACKEHLTQYPRLLSERLGCTIVCKDARTVVAQKQGACYLNTTGNAGMATAGSGDVLAGMIAGLTAQGMSGQKAAVTGTYLHGLSGDMAAEAMSQEAMTATDIIAKIPAAIKACRQAEASSTGQKEGMLRDGGSYVGELSESVCGG